MKICVLLCFHVHVHLQKNMYVFMYLVLTFDPTGNGSIGIHWPCGSKCRNACKYIYETQHTKEHQLYTQQ